MLEQAEDCQRSLIFENQPFAERFKTLLENSARRNLQLAPPAGEHARPSACA